MANPELGAKQLCPNCQAKFYDLGRRPAHCPKCASDFDPDEVVRSRRVRARAAPIDHDTEEEDLIRGKKAVSDDEDDEDAAPEVEEVADEVPIVASDDEDDDVEPAAGVAGADDLGEFSDDEELDDADDVPFLVGDEDDDFDDTEIDGLPGEGDAEDR